MSTRRNRHVVYALSCLDGPPVYVGVTGSLEERIAGHWDACRNNDRPLQVWMRQLRYESDLTVTTLCEWEPSTEVLFGFHEQRVEEVLIRQIAERTLRYRGIVTLNLRCNPFRSFGVNPAVRFDASDSIVRLHGWRAWALAEEICPYNCKNVAIARPRDLTDRELRELFQPSTAAKHLQPTGGAK